MGSIVRGPTPLRWARGPACATRVAASGPARPFERTRAGSCKGVVPSQLPRLDVGTRRLLGEHTDRLAVDPHVGTVLKGELEVSARFGGERIFSAG